MDRFSDRGSIPLISTKRKSTPKGAFPFGGDGTIFIKTIPSKEFLSDVWE